MQFRWCCWIRNHAANYFCWLNVNYSYTNARKHHDWVMDRWQRVAWSEKSPFILQHLMDMSGYNLIHVSCCSSVYYRSFTILYWRYYALDNILVDFFGTCDCGITDQESHGLSENPCGQVAPLHFIYFPKCRRNLQARQCSMSQGSHYAVEVLRTWKGIPVKFLAT